MMKEKKEIKNVGVYLDTEACEMIERLKDLLSSNSRSQIVRFAIRELYKNLTEKEEKKNES